MGYLYPPELDGLDLYQVWQTPFSKDALPTLTDGLHRGGPQAHGTPPRAVTRPSAISGRRRPAARRSARRPPRRGRRPPRRRRRPRASAADRRTSPCRRSGRIEEDEVGPLPRLDPPAVAEAEPVGRARREPRHRLLDRQQPSRMAEPPEEARRGARSSRGCGRAPKMPSEPTSWSRWRGDRRARRRRRRSGAPSSRRGPTPPSGRAPPRPRRCRGSRRSPPSVRPTASSLGGAAFAISMLLRPEGAEEVLPAGQAVRDVARDPPPLAGGCRASGASPARRPPAPRRAGCSRAGCCRRRRGTGRSVTSISVDGVVEQLEQRLDEALVGERLEVGEVERRPRAARDVDHLLDRRPAGRAPRCARAGRAARPLRRLLRDGDELVRRRVGAGQVDEPEGQHPRSRLEAEPDLASHRPQLTRRSARRGRRRARGRARRRGRSRGRARARAASRRARRGTPPPSTTATSPGPAPRAVAGRPAAPRAGPGRRAPARARPG